MATVPAVLATTEKPYPTGKYAWYVVSVLTVISIAGYLDANVLALMVGPVRRDLAISDSQMSLLLGSSYALFYGLFGILIGRWVDSYNRRNIIAAGCALWSIATAACGLTRSYFQLLLMRMGVGVGEATLFPAAYSLIADCFPKERLATAMSVFSTSLHLGQGLAFALGGLLIGFVSSHERMSLPLVGATPSWQVAFIIIGLPGIGLALLMLTTREPERRSARSIHATIQQSQSTPVPLRQVIRYFWDNRGALLCLAAGLGLSALPSYAVWVPSVFIRNYGWSATQTGMVYGTTMAIAGTMGVMAGGRFADWLATRGYRDANMRLCLIVSLAWFPTGVLFPLMPTGGWAIVMFIPSYFFAGAPWGAAAAAIQQIMPNSMRGQATGIYRFTIYLIGGALGPILVALLTDHVFQDDAALKYSLVIVGTLGKLGSTLLLWRGLKYFRISLERARA